MSAKGSAPLRVLVVDDLEDDTYITAKLLEMLGCSVRACNHAHRAVEVARQFEPHLILLDLAMPGQSGLEVAHALREASLPPFYLVAKTGLVDGKHTQQCLNSGFRQVLVKPVSLEQFRPLLELARQLAE